MNKDVSFYVAVMIFGIFISSLSQVMLKKSAMKKYATPVQEYLNPLVMGAYLIFFISTFCSIYAYKVVPLTWGPIIGSSGYFFVTLFGMIFFGERMNWKKGVSLCMIVAGILIFSLT